MKHRWHYDKKKDKVLCLRKKCKVTKAENILSSKRTIRHDISDQPYVCKK